MPDLDAGAHKEPKQTSGATYPRTSPSSDGPERQAHVVRTRDEVEALAPQESEQQSDEGEQG